MIAGVHFVRVWDMALMIWGFVTWALLMMAVAYVRSLPFDRRENRCSATFGGVQCHRTAGHNVLAHVNYPAGASRRGVRWPVEG